MRDAGAARAAHAHRQRLDPLCPAVHGAGREPSRRTLQRYRRPSAVDLEARAPPARRRLRAGAQHIASPPGPDGRAPAPRVGRHPPRADVAGRVLRAHDQQVRHRSAPDRRRSPGRPSARSTRRAGSRAAPPAAGCATSVRYTSSRARRVGPVNRSVALFARPRRRARSSPATRTCTTGRGGTVSRNSLRDEVTVRPWWRRPTRRWYSPSGAIRPALLRPSQRKRWRRPRSQGDVLGERAHLVAVTRHDRHGHVVGAAQAKREQRHIEAPVAVGREAAPERELLDHRQPPASAAW